MTEFWTAIVTSLRKIGPVPLIALGFVCAFLLFARRNWLAQFGVESFVDQNRGAVGISALIVWALIGANVIWWLRGLLTQKYKSNRIKKVRTQALSELTPDEKAFLLPYIKESVASRIVSLGNGIVGGLVSKEILYRTATAAPWGDFPYNLQPWARRHLTEHPELLAGASHVEEPEKARRERRRSW